MSDQMSDLGRLHIINRFWLFTIIPCQTRCKIWSCFILSTGSDYLELSYVRPDVRFEHIIYRFWLFRIILCQTRCEIWACFILSTGSDYLQLSYVRPDVRSEHASYYQQVLIILNYPMSDQMWDLSMLHIIYMFWLFRIILRPNRYEIWACFILSTGSDYLELSHVRLNVRSGHAS